MAFNQAKELIEDLKVFFDFWKEGEGLSLIHI